MTPNTLLLWVMLSWLMVFHHKAKEDKISNNSLGRKGYSFPRGFIEHAVWLYFRFSLSLRDVEELLAKRGITVSHETIRFWIGKFDRRYAKSI